MSRGELDKSHVLQRCWMCGPGECSTLAVEKYCSTLAAEQDAYDMGAKRYRVALARALEFIDMCAEKGLPPGSGSTGDIIRRHGIDPETLRAVFK